MKKNTFSFLLSFAVALGATSCDGNGQNSDDTNPQDTVRTEVQKYCDARTAFSESADKSRTIGEYMQLDRRPYQAVGSESIELSDAEKDLLAKTLIESIRTERNTYFRLCRLGEIDVQNQIVLFNNRIIHIEAPGVLDSLKNTASSMADYINSFENYFE